MALTKVQTIGIETGISLTGVTTVTTLNASTDTLSVGGTVNFGGNVSIAGTLTYEDVTNIDSVGLITARNGIKVDDLGVQVGTGATVDSAGDNILTFLTNGNERIRVDSSGNFGINDTGPNFPLDVNGNIGIREGQVLTWHDGAGNKAGDIYMDSSDNFVIRNTSSVTERMRINSSGNMGLGTASPSAPFHIDNPGDTSITQILETGNAQVSLVLRNSTSTGNNIQLNATGNDFRILTNASERLRIDSSGRLLVGVTSSFANANADDLQVGNNSASAESGITLGSTTGSGIRFADAGSTNAGIIEYAHASDSMRLYTSGTEQIRIDSSGRLLVGATSGDYDLEVKKSGAVALLVGSTNAGSATLILDGDSNGDGTGSDYATIGHASTGNLEYKNRDNGTHTFHTGSSDTERLRIDSSGRLLVGTTSSKESLSNIQCVRSSESTLSIFTSDISASGKAKINLGPSNNITGAQIICDAEEDFSTGTNRTGRLSFTTRKDGTIVERVRIASDGDVRIGDYNTVNRNAGLSINKSDARLLEMRCGSGTETNYVKRYAFAFTRSTSETTVNLCSLGAVTGNSHVVIEIKMYAVCAVANQAAIITAYAHARQVNNGSYNYQTQTPTAQFIVGTGIAVGSLSWSSGVLQYTTDANNNYTKYNTEITAWAHDRMDIGFY